VSPLGRAWLLPAIVAGACLAAMAPGAFEALRYERALVPAEPWRLLTAHLVHLGWIHLALNIAALAAAWALLGGLLRAGAWSAALLACALGVSAGLWLRHPELVWYVGLSGVLHGLFTVGAVAGLRRAPLFHGLLLAGVVAKVAWEQFTGTGAGTSALIGGAVIVDAHLYGVLAGLALAPLAWATAAPSRNGPAGG
jgi:rhomboid family GlyGly-CTERM serine protease